MKKILYRALVSCPDGKATLLRQCFLFSQQSSAVTDLELTPQNSHSRWGPLLDDTWQSRLAPSWDTSQESLFIPIHESTEGNRVAVGDVGTAGPKALLDIFAD